MAAYLSPRRSHRLPTYSRAVTRGDQLHLQNVRSEMHKILVECQEEAKKSQEKFDNNLHSETLVKAFTRIYTKESIKRRFPLVGSVRTLEELLTTLELRQLRGEDKVARAEVKRFYTLCQEIIRDLQVVWDKLVDICKALNAYLRGYEEFDQKAQTRELLEKLKNLRFSLPVKCKGISGCILQQDQDAGSSKHPAIAPPGVTSSREDLFRPVLDFFASLFDKLADAFGDVKQWLDGDENYMDLLCQDRDAVRHERLVLRRDVVTKQRELVRLRVPENVKSLGQRLEFLNAEIKHLEDDKNSLTEEINRSDLELESCKVKRVKLDHDMESAGTSDAVEDAIAMSNLGKEITKLARKASELENTIVSLGFRLERVRKQLAQKRQERDCLEFKYRRLTGLELRRKELQKRVKEIQTDLHRLDGKVEALDVIMLRKVDLVRQVFGAESLMESLGSYNAEVRSLSPGTEVSHPLSRSPYLSPTPAGRGSLTPILPEIGDNMMMSLSLKSRVLESTFQYLKESPPIGREWPNIFRKLPWPKGFSVHHVEREIGEIRKSTRSLKEQAYRALKRWEVVAGEMATKAYLIDTLVECKLVRIAETVARKTKGS